jgi:hypothetical protein
MRTLAFYFEQFALISAEKQEKFARLAEEHFIEKDLDSGIARFSRDLELPFQVLGTESENTLTWLWAWAEEQTELPADLLNSSLQMREWGEREKIRECTAASVDLHSADGRIFSVVASEVCKASCYYRESYEGGALFLLLFGDAVDRQPSLDVAGLTRGFSDLMIYPFNHRNALVSYLNAKGLVFTSMGDAVACRLDSGEDLHAEFDAGGALQAINGTSVV